MILNTKFWTLSIALTDLNELAMKLQEDCKDL